MRLAAYLIDSIIVGVVLAIAVRFPIWISSLVSPDNIVVRDFIFEYSIADIVVYLMGAGYFIVLTYKNGATIGKKLLHIKVISAEDREMTLFEVIYRETVGRFLSGLIAYVGYFMILVHGDKCGLHDLMADTRVIYCHDSDVRVETPVDKSTTIIDEAVPPEDSEYVAASYTEVVPSEVDEEMESDDGSKVSTDAEI